LIRRVTLLLCSMLLASAQALAEPTRESLIDAWEHHIAALPGTERLEPIGDLHYLLADDELPYEGEVRISSALVRHAETGGADVEFTHFGIVEFDLPDLPAERLGSQSFYYWQSDRQMLHYSADEEAWVDPAAYRAAMAEQYAGATSFGALSFMLNYGIWGLLVALVAFVFVVAARQGRKARSLMDDSASINDKARENLVRSEKLQDEVLAIARETRDLQAENNELLKQMVAALNR